MEIPTLTTMVVNLGNSMPAVMRMLTGLAYVMGLFFFFSAIYKLKQYGDLRTMMSSSTDLRAPIIQLILGGVFVFFPSLLHVGMSTIFNTPNPLAYQDTSGSTHQDIIMAVIRIMEVIGVVAVIRGLTLLGRAGNQGQPGMVGKGAMHLVAGILAINIYGTWQVLENTLGFAVS